MASLSLDVSWHPALLDALRALPNIRQACQAVGVTRTVLNDHREADPTFDAQVDLALEDGRDTIRRLIATKALGTRQPDGTFKGGSDRMMELLAKVYLPELRQRSTDLTSGGKPIGAAPPKVDVQINLDSRSPVRELGAGVELYATGDEVPDQPEGSSGNGGE